MINLNDLLPGNSNSPDSNYPYGSGRNIVVSGDGTGTPFLAALQNDLYGLQQKLLSEAGIVPNGSSDDAVNSQQFDAMWKLFNMRTLTHNFTSDADYTLTDADNLKRRYVFTDTNPFLTTSRNVLIDTTEKRFILENQTLQDLSVIVNGTSGSSINVPPSSIKDLYSDGENVSDLNEIIESTGALTVDNFIHVQDQKPNGTNGGDSVLGNNDRVLNTVLTNTISGASLSSNEITLPIGKYYIEAIATVFDVNGASQLRIYDVTNTSILINGLNLKCIESGNGLMVYNTVSGIIDVVSPINIKLQHYIGEADTNGLGIAVSSGEVEIYADAKIWKVG